MEKLNNDANVTKPADSPIANLASAVAENTDFTMKINPDIHYGIVDGARGFIDMDMLMSDLENPLNRAGEPVEIHTREDYKIYNCLKNMPHCIKSMKITRGDKDGKIGTNRPLENTICVAVHHLDDKSYGGLCVLREWGAVDMTTIFVGYNPLQTKIWGEMIDDIPDSLFTACILEPESSSANAPVWAEGTYKIAEDFYKFPHEKQLPTGEFNNIFKGKMSQPSQPLPFLDAQRSLCAYNFLRAIAQGHNENKKVFIWEDGGYLNPIIDEAIEAGLTVAQFRSKYLLPADEATDSCLDEYFATALEDVFIGSVELTRNGYDMSAAISEKRHMNTKLFSIAASYEKIMLEGDSITLSCIDALSQVLYSTGCGLRDRTVLVMGARGNLGRLSVNHLANLLGKPKEQLWGCDLKVDWPNPEPGTVPEWIEWASSDKPLDNVAGEVVSYRKLSEEVRYGFDVILGWTGGAKTVCKDGKKIHYQTISGQDVADWLTKGRKKSNLYLVSGSTKTVEFSDVLKWLEDVISTPEEKRSINGITVDELIVEAIPDRLSSAAVLQMWPCKNPPGAIKRNFGTMFTFKFKQDGVQVTKTLYLVNNTMPVNFMFYGTPTEIMDMTYSQVTSCAAALVRDKNDDKGIYPTDYSKRASDGVYLARKLDKDYPIPKYIHISEDDIFEGAKTAYTAYFAYVNTLIKEIGKERTLKLMTESDTARGSNVGADIKAKAGGKDFSVQEAMETIIEMAKGIGGIDTIIELNDKEGRTVTEFGKCPVYEAGKANGMEDELIEELCRASSLAFLNSVVNQLNPMLCYKVSAFRSEKYGGCLEEIVHKMQEEL